MRAFGSQPSPTLCPPHAVSWSGSSRRTTWCTREMPNRHGHAAGTRSSGRPTSLTWRLDDQGVPFRTITAIFASVWVLSELQGTEVDKRTQPAMKLPRKAITRAERSGRDINMRPHWLQKDKSRVGKQSEMVRRRAAARGLGDEAWLHWTAPSRESPLADVDHRGFRGLKVKNVQGEGRRHKLSLPGGPGSRDAAQDLGTYKSDPVPQGGTGGGLVLGKGPSIPGSDGHPRPAR
jgi:hypothetical protein